MPAPSPFNPLDRLDPGEDVFPIREKDPAGPETLTFWASVRRKLAVKRYGTHPTGDAKRLFEAELAQCKEADDKALAWSERQHGGEAADERKATYADVAQSAEQIAAAKRQKLADALAHHLAEADYCAHELLELDGPAATPAMAEQADAIHMLVMADKAVRAEAA
jgi:hypothetical protein